MPVNFSVSECVKHRKTIVIHLLLWLLPFCFLSYLYASEGALNQGLIRYGLFGLVNMLLFYINYLIILPYYLNSRRFWGCALSVLTLLVCSSLAKLWLATVFQSYIFRGTSTASGEYIQMLVQYFLGSMIISIIFIGLSTGLKFSTDWFRNETIRRNLENEKLSAELTFLKSQINPHFLFNSLNNIYALSYRQSSKTPEAILKLSEMMRYMLNESNELFVPLSREIAYIQNYIELQRLRFKDGGNVSLTIEGNLENRMIAPLILIPFIENAFKHGIANNPDSPIVISIKLGDGLDFTLSNLKSRHNKDESSGVGLNNVHRRLNLLYPNKHSLQINEDIFTYNCHLTLEI